MSISDNILMDRAYYEKYSYQEIVYAPKWYYSKEVTLDKYSTKLYHSKTEDKSWYFKNTVIDLINALKKYGEVDFDKIELITIIPSHKPGVHSITLNKLGDIISKYLGVKYEKILTRIKNTRPNDERHKEADERYMHVKDSITLSRALTERNVMIFDDVKTTGIDILEAIKVLKESGVENTTTICLGINSKKIQSTETMIYCEGGHIWRENI